MHQFLHCIIAVVFITTGAANQIIICLIKEAVIWDREPFQIEDVVGATLEMLKTFEINLEPFRMSRIDIC